jgi:acetolactate synthase-1/2/3 large subunit
MKVHQAVAETLAAHGVSTVFGLMGNGNLLYLTDFISRHGGRFVAAVHESGAVSMADGYSRVSNSLGVASITHGPAVTNSLTALVEAVRNGSQLLLLTGDTPASPDDAQGLDIAAAVAASGAGYDRVYRADSVVRDVSRAMNRTVAAGKPVVLNIPQDLMAEETAESCGPVPRPVQLRSAPDLDAIDDALGAILGARNPVVLAGRGAVLSGAHSDLIELADLVQAPVATTLLAKDLFRGHRLDLGIFGTLCTSIASATIVRSDCVVAFGASLNQWTSDHHALTRGKRIVQCDSNASRFGAYTPVDVPLHGDARTTAAAITSRMRAVGYAPASRNAALKRDLAAANPREEFRDVTGDNTLDLRAALIRLDELLPLHRNVVTDAGRFMLAPWRYLHVGEAGCFVQAVNFGSIGLGLATAIGAAAARPGQITVAVVGDGGFMMSAVEFTTAVRNRLPLLLVVANDGAYGAEYRDLESHGIDTSFSLNNWPDLVSMAVAMGGSGFTARSMGDIEKVADLAKKLQGPLLVDLRLDPVHDFSSLVASPRGQLP